MVKSENAAGLGLKLALIALALAYSLFIGAFIHKLRPDEITDFAPPFMVMFVFRIGQAGFAAINGVLIALFLFRDSLFQDARAKLSAKFSLIVFATLNAVAIMSLLKLFSGPSF